MRSRYLGCYGSLVLTPPKRPKPGAPTYSGNIRQLTFDSEVLEDRLDILVYLPPGYSSQDSWQYPILYLHDGQNVFDENTAVFGVEWGVDEAAERLIHGRQMRGIIIVAVANTPDRIELYTPFPDPKHGGGEGPRYLDFMVNELKPWIDKQFSTTDRAEHTAVAGSSLGGLSALYLAWSRPDVFGIAAGISPSLWWGGRGFITAVAGDEKAKMPARIWLDMGTEESSADLNRNGVPDVIDDVRALRAILLSKGYILGESLFYREVEGGTHDEAAWADRIDDVLKALFPLREPGLQ